MNTKDQDYQDEVDFVEMNQPDRYPRKPATVRRPSWVSYDLPGSNIQGTQEFPTKGRAKRFIRMLRREHRDAIKIDRSWTSEVR